MSLRFLSAQWAATAYVGVVSLGLNFLVARLLGPALFGDYGVAFAAGTMLGIFPDGGFKTLLVRERTPGHAGCLAGFPPITAGVAGLAECASADMASATHCFIGWFCIYRCADFYGRMGDQSGIWGSLS